MTTFNDLAGLVPNSPWAEVDWAALLESIPALRALAVTPQDPIHHAEGDVWTHTRMVVDELRRLADFETADENRRFVLFYAALLHDVAKPPCTVVHEDGRVSSAGHSRRGAVDVRVLLWRAGVPFDVRERVARIVQHHQMPFFAVKGDRSGRSPECIVRRLASEVSLRELATVAEADARGRVCADGGETLVNIELFRLMAEEDGCLDGPRAFPDAATRVAYFRGNGAISPDYPFHVEFGSRVTVLSGLPAAGKDTWSAENARGRAVLSFDAARAELGVRHGTDAAGGAAHLVIERAKGLLRRQEPFVWNATHLSEESRQRTLDLLYRYGAEVEIVYLEEPEDVIRRRNRDRDTTLTDAAIDRMLHHWEVPCDREAHEVYHLVGGTDCGERRRRGQAPAHRA
jgi:predicted kinase